MASNMAPSMQDTCIGTLQAYYLITFSCTAFVSPYLNIYFKRLGFSEDTIGLLSAVHPWISAASGMHAHTPVRLD